MRWLTTFLYVFKNSLLAPRYYRDVVRAPFSFSLLFFCGYFFFYAIVGTVYMTSKIVQPLSKLIMTLPAHLERVYPKGLEVTIRKGEVSTNVPEPFAIPVDWVEKAFSDTVLGAQTPSVENLLVIDTKGSVDNFASYKTYALVTRTLVAYVHSDGGYRVSPLTNVPDAAINQKLVAQFISSLSPFLSYLPTLLVGFVLFALLVILPLWTLLSLLFYALVLMILSNLMHVSLPYKKAYQVSLHLVILPLTVFGIFQLIGRPVVFPFLNSIVFVGFGFFVLRNLAAEPLKRFSRSRALK